MAVTVKELAKRERVSRQAIRARIHRIPGFEDNYTTRGKNHERLVSDKGAQILHQHRNKPHKYFTMHDKRLLDTKLNDLRAINNNLEYQIKHSDKNIVISQIKHNNKDLRVANEQLRNDINYWREMALSEQATNRELDYYAHTNWIERLLGMKRDLKRLPASARTVKPAEHKNNK